MEKSVSVDIKKLRYKAVKIQFNGELLHTNLERFYEKENDKPIKFSLVMNQLS